MDTQELIRYCTTQLPDSMKARPWDATNHGRAILQTEEQLNAYIAAYGEMHFIKCRAALQNFPFDGLTNYEIVDWGCGQGIASLTLYDMLKEHGKVYGLKRITLIEPSEPALRRAEAFVKRAVDQRVEVIAINKCIPSSEVSKDLSEVASSAPMAIHLFSNILDIRTLSLRWLAKKVASFTRQQQIVCVGPAMRGESRISDFAGFFPEKNVFSRISQYPYAYTETHHPFGCETMCFSLSSSNINENYVEKANEATFIDDYSYVAESLRGIVNDNIINAYNAIRAKLSDSDSIFIQPHISTDVPDIVVVRPGKGMLIFNICNDKNNAEAQFERTEVYQRNLYNVHLRDVFGKALLNTSYWSAIKQAIFFPTEKDGENIGVSKDKYKYVARIYRDDILADNLLEKLNLSWDNRYFTDDLCRNVLELITSKGWHSYKEGNENITPTKRQRELAQSKSVEQKIKGVAGSGKTQVLAWRAVNAQVRTGGRVLVLTFNLTLVNYIKYRMSQVAADFNWGQFDITNYHQFFKSQANNHNLKPHIDDWDDENFFERYKKYTMRYDTILFDEAQDYRYAWYLVIKNYFLKEGGEFVVFGDGRQNIYSRQQDTDHTPRVPVMGRWTQINENSNTTFRIENPEIARLSTLFQETFFDYSEPLAQQSMMPFEQFYIKYWNVGRDVTAETLCSNVFWIINEFKLDRRDVTVLSQTCSVLRGVEEAYIKNGGEQPITTFETKEEYDRIKAVSKWPKADIDSIRRVKKVHFTIDYAGIKMATIHSFKGWESPAVILILQPEGTIEDDVYNVIENENSPALIYTAITRAKRNLFILNLGNSKYHDFFTNNIEA